jgi:D-alanine-D-alanine ligase-like ATP-grasp enzyme
MTRHLKIALLFGGRSGEHEVSLASAASVLSAIDPERSERAHALTSKRSTVLFSSVLRLDRSEVAADICWVAPTLVWVDSKMALIACATVLAAARLAGADVLAHLGDDHADDAVGRRPQRGLVQPPLEHRERGRRGLDLRVGDGALLPGRPGDPGIVVRLCLFGFFFNLQV